MHCSCSWNLHRKLFEVSNAKTESGRLVKLIKSMSDNDLQIKFCMFLFGLCENIKALYTSLIVTVAIGHMKKSKVLNNYCLD